MWSAWSFLIHNNFYSIDFGPILTSYAGISRIIHVQWYAIWQGLWVCLLTHSRPKLQLRFYNENFLGFTFIGHKIPWHFCFTTTMTSCKPPNNNTATNGPVPVPSWKGRDCNTLDDAFALVSKQCSCFFDIFSPKLISHVVAPYMFRSSTMVLIVAMPLS